MREDGGYEVIKKAINKLGLRHKEHIAAYGEGNERRLTGKHETADINTFLWVNNPLDFLFFLSWALFCFGSLIVLCQIGRVWQTEEHPSGWDGTQRKIGKDILKIEGLLPTWIHMLSLV